MLREFIYRRMLSEKKSDNTGNSWHEKKCPPIPSTRPLGEALVYTVGRKRRVLDPARVEGSG
jgi:hypothetical protein